MCSKKIAFTPSEKELIGALVREPPIIEDKRTNARNIELKKKAWEDLTVAFNSQPYVSQRNNIQLKRCWENIKTFRKKELSLKAASLRRTSASNSSDNRVDIICPSVNLKVPHAIDSNSNEILTESEMDHTAKMEFENDVMTADINVIGETDGNVPPKSKISEMDTPKGSQNLNLETRARIRRSGLNTPNDQALFELRLERERILVEREKNLLKFEKICHQLQIEKLKLEIRKLKEKE